MKECMNYRNTFLLALLIVLAGCKTGKINEFTNRSFAETSFRPFVLPEAVFPPNDIQNLQLHPAGIETGPPVISLNGSKKLILAFDHLFDEARQFRISISHRSQNWRKSPLSPVAFTAGFFEDYFGGGVSSFTQTPSYRHYEYHFPNERLQITKSGNYLLSVFNSGSDELLFRIPFFVSEDAGQLQTRVQTLFGQQNNAGSIVQLLSSYQYPAFVTQPQFDLSFSYAPNHFWGRMRIVDNSFYAGNGLVEFYLNRNKAFANNSGFNYLDLRAFPPAGSEILEFIPGKRPPVVVLKRDVEPFSTIAAPRHTVIPGPLHDRQSQYFSVHFQLEPASDISASTKVYLVGGFTNWAIDERFRMQLDASDSLWKGNALVKQGLYAYKYILLKNGRIEGLSPEGFSNQQQFYLTFVYYRDPELHYDRLLKVGRTVRF